MPVQYAEDSRRRLTMINIRINHLEKPLGYKLEDLSVSWITETAHTGRAEKEHIRIATDPDMQKVIAQREGKLNRFGECFDLSLKPRTEYFVKVEETDEAGHVYEGFTTFETGKMNEPWKAKRISTRESDTFHPEFIKAFHCAKEVKKARLYISGLGLYDAFLNGKRIGEEWLKPYFSDYHKEIQIQTFDLAEDILPGENSLHVLLGSGWYKGRFGLSGGPVNNYGDRFSLLAELRIVYTDGSEEVIGTDESWQYRQSFITASDIYDGETHDYMHYDPASDLTYAAEYTLDTPLTDRISLPVTVYKELPVKEVIHTPAGETVLDFGQNFAGVVRFACREEKGTEIVLDFGEILQKGSFYNANYRSAKSRFTYISDGEERTVTPLFTYFGFRYVRVTGCKKEVKAEDFAGLALSSAMEDTLSVSTGSPMTDKLIQNTWWGMRSNFMDIPTDCPQRDERLGWSGDAMVFSGTALYLSDASAFYEHFLHELLEASKEYDGIAPGVLPVQKGGPVYAAVWGDIATILPMNVYRSNGDKAQLKRYYPLMKAWVERIHADDVKRGEKNLWDFGDQLGDWLALDGRSAQSMQGATDPYFIASCYYAYSVKLTAEAADILGFKEDVAGLRKLHEKILTAIHRSYFTATGRLAVDTQTAYVTALYTDVCPDRKAVIDGFRNRLYLDCYKIRGGFVGAPLLCRVLAENGMEKEAEYILLQKGYPGWMHCIDLGATTIWERWNSVLDNGLLSGTMMNSLNHYSFGAVCEYIFRDICGIKAEKPGYETAFIAPKPSRAFPMLDMSLKTAAGTYQISWKTEGDKAEITVTVPYNAHAKVQLPFGNEIIAMDAGTRTFTCVSESLKQKYSTRTLFVEMKDDPEAMEAIRRNSGFLFGAVSSGDDDFLYDCLETLRKKEFLGFHKEKVDRLEKELLAL